VRRLLDRKDEYGVSAGDGNVLFVAGEKRHRPRSDLTAGLELPQRLPLFASSAKKLLKKSDRVR